MFTGIIEEVGIIAGLHDSGDGRFIRVNAKKVLTDVRVGDSIAVNGVCLTVTEFTDSMFTAFASRITSELTSLGYIKIGSAVNLERAMSANGRFGGHIVQGHVDGMGTIVSIKHDQHGIEYVVSCDNSVLRYIVDKGAVAVDGISLTVVESYSDSFVLYIIPETVKQTSLSEKKVGDKVNIEVDVLGKYIEKFLKLGATDKTKSDSEMMDLLSKNGFI